MLLFKFKFLGTLALSLLIHFPAEDSDFKMAQLQAVSSGEVLSLQSCRLAFPVSGCFLLPILPVILNKHVAVPQKGFSFASSFPTLCFPPKCLFPQGVLAQTPSVCCPPCRRTLTLDRVLSVPLPACARRLRLSSVSSAECSAWRSVDSM